MLNIIDRITGKTLAKAPTWAKAKIIIKKLLDVDYEEKVLRRGNDPETFNENRYCITN